jgi:hypothetical protein
MMKLRTREARQFQGQALHQGVVMMGGNDQVALAISKHWRDERESNNTTTTQNQPWKELLQFFGEAVSATVEEAAPALVPSTRGEKRKAEIDIEVFAKRVCIDVVETHTNNMLRRLLAQKLLVALRHI